MEKVEEDYSLLVVSENGYGKRTNFDQYNAQKRGGGGVITMRTGGRNGALVGAASVRAGDELMLISTEGQMIRMPVDQIRVIGRATKGVRLINLDQTDKLVSLAKVAEEEPEIEEASDKEEAKSE
jgi:DNA gyrase subunit A